MRVSLRATILGCGCSSGVPRLGGPDGAGDWGACDPTDPRNRRTRCGLMVEQKRADDPWEDAYITRVLVDTSPDLRAQLLAARVSWVDAVLYTHDHADQVNGLDDLRIVAGLMRKRVPVHMDPVTADTLIARFSYAFHQAPGSLYPAVLDALIDLAPGVAVTIEGRGGPLRALALQQSHGPIDSLGFRFGPIAYSNDCVALPDATLEALEDLDVWIVDALKHTPHRTHASVATALGWIERLRPREAVLTNMHPDLDYAALDAVTPAHVRPAYDGLVVEATTTVDAPTPAAV